MRRYLLKRKKKVHSSKLSYCAHHIILLVCSRDILSKFSVSLLMGTKGRCYPEEVLKKYLNLCSRYRLHIISDEIYALSVWNNPLLPNDAGFTSILSISLEGIIDLSFVHAIWGLSKVCYLTLLLRAKLTELSRTLVQLGYGWAAWLVSQISCS